MLDLHHLETFRVLAATRNFTRAALELGYSQATVTTHIKALERELGVALFVRWKFSRTVTLTAVGDKMLSYAQRMLALAAETKAVAKSRRRSSELRPPEVFS